MWPDRHHRSKPLNTPAPTGQDAQHPSTRVECSLTAACVLRSIWTTVRPMACLIKPSRDYGNALVAVIADTTVDILAVILNFILLSCHRR